MTINTVLILMLVVNSGVVLTLATMIFNKVHSEKAASEMADAEASAKYHKKIKVPLEYFVVNLSSAHGREVLKLALELEVADPSVIVELSEKKVQIRHSITTILSNKTLEDVSRAGGIEATKTEIKMAINGLLKAKIDNVFVTEYLYN